MTDPIIVETTAAILFQAYPREARQIATALADDNRTIGNSDRAQMWEEIILSLEDMLRRHRVH